MQKIEVKKIEEKEDYQSNEAYKRLRTNLQLCGAERKVIVISSCLPNEGKSTTTMNLSISLAEVGQRVLLVDADLRKSVMAGKYHIGRMTKGLSHYLAGQVPLEQIVCETNISGLNVILAGPTMPNPAEMLASDIFKRLLKEARQVYDYVIVDAPPIGSVIDAAIIAPYCDGTILIIAAGEISKNFALNVKKQLEKTGTPLLGVVLNKVDTNSDKYYNKYYGKYYGTES